jgi:hypothetical protein
MSQPVCRRPRSHAYRCRCSRCVYSMPDNSAAAVFWGPLIFLAIAFWPEYALHGRASVIAGIAWWGSIAVIGALILAACLNGKRQPRPRKAPPPGPPMSSLPPAPQSPPACRHLNAGPLVNRVSLGPVAWFCEECGTGLPREFGDRMRSCCGTPPGTPHLYNCACRKEVII